MTSSILNLLFLISLSFLLPFIVQGKENVYVVYRGGGELLISQASTYLSHFQLLASVLESEDAAMKNMVHMYSHVFSGFAAKMTESHAGKLSAFPGVLKVFKSKMYKLHTTRSWDYLGLPLDSSSPFSPTINDNILHSTNMGDGAIIGIIDSGISPGSKSLSDEGLGPIPTRWKGICQEGQRFNTSNCNRKLIGARWFVDGLVAEIGLRKETIQMTDDLSPVDRIGHGTHTATIAGGSIVKNVSYSGLANGNVRGGAPKARLAVYKACWNVPGGDCSSVDVLKAIDMAIHDGVDVLSISLGEHGISSDFDNAIMLGSFHAVNKGIAVVCSDGNGGPQAHTVINTAPWILTVAANSIDRSFPVPLTLGNNQTLAGQMFRNGNTVSSAGLYFQENVSGFCEDIEFEKLIQGKVVFCYAESISFDIEDYLESFNLSAAGLIVANKEYSGMVANYSVPAVTVNYEIGWKILNYIHSTSSPHISIGPATTLVGKPTSTKIPYFSSRGPHPMIPEILKPDIAAPGVNVLAGSNESSYIFLSGTSMSAPHVSGIVALLKSLHPDWSPAAIKSAIVTTGWTSDPWGEPIYAEGNPMKLADAFDYGGGIANPNAAADPGLLYDMGFEDYVRYLCSIGGYKLNDFICPSQQFSFLDMNLPSIVVPNLIKSATLTRTVTNVGPVDSVYRVNIKAPPGIYVEVTPRSLVFDSNVRNASFALKVSTSHTVSTGYQFGSLTWTDGKHIVRSPLVVWTKILLHG